MELTFATNNRNKINEVLPLLNNRARIVSLKEIGCKEELPETGDTLEANAKQKAKYVYDKYRVNCFADDTGLKVRALNGRPGVLSARYAGPDQNAEMNMSKLLSELKGHTDRSAIFKTVIYLIINKKQYLFEGNIYGTILTEKRGKNGFGYDPIFQPAGYDHSFAEMNLEDKNRISHRAAAIKKLAEFLNSIKD